MLQSLFNKVAGLKACYFNEKETQTQVLSCKISNSLRTLILKNIRERLHLMTYVMANYCTFFPYKKRLFSSGFIANTKTQR